MIYFSVKLNPLGILLEMTEQISIIFDLSRSRILKERRGGREGERKREREGYKSCKFQIAEYLKIHKSAVSSSYFDASCRTAQIYMKKMYAHQ